MPATQAMSAAVLGGRDDKPLEVQTAMIDAVLGGGGLDSVANLAAGAAGGPVAIVVPRLCASIASGPDPTGETLQALTAWVAAQGRERPADLPGSVLSHLPIRFRGEIAGVVALLRDETPARQHAFDYLAPAVVGALMQLAIQDAREETEQRLRWSFLEELRSREGLTGDEIVRRAARLGCDLSGGGIVLCATVTSERANLVIATIVAEHSGALVQQLDDDDGDRGPRVYAVLPTGVGGGTPAAAQASARQLAERLHRHAVVGLSSFHADPAKLAEAINEAELVLDVLRQSGRPIADEIGNVTYRLLFRMLTSHPDEIQTFFESTVATLVRYDDTYHTDLVRTLQAYLDSNCNMNATAAAVFAHRHTVAYRLERIRELTGLDPMLSEHRERLGIGLKIHRIAPPLAPRL